MRPAQARGRQRRRALEEGGLVVGPGGMVEATLTEALLAQLHEHRIYFSAVPRERVRAGQTISFHRDAVVERYASFLAGASLCTAGAYSYSWSPTPALMRMGRYCSLAAGITHLGQRHPLHTVSTSGFAYAKHFRMFRQALEDAGASDFSYPKLWNNPYEFAVLQDDVWVGEGALLGRNITIGTGAVIAAHAVVTKDVEPYAIVAGNPGRVKRLRFDEPMIERLLASRWWDYAYTDFFRMDPGDPDRFLGRLAEAAAAGTIHKIPAARPLIELVREGLAAGS